MAGNVQEWCWDWFRMDYYRLNDAGSNPQGPREDEAEYLDFGGEKRKGRVLRGGSWCDNPTLASASCRVVSTPDFRDTNQGLRLVCLMR